MTTRLGLQREILPEAENLRCTIYKIQQSMSSIPHDSVDERVLRKAEAAMDGLIDWANAIMDEGDFE